ncbi:dual specificity protein phosphatase 14-like [Dendronephthya gigantea]|uniref:dual specificity protein phosphatase 14-like n=1 Tax=Dendronephthya gigantea TaxID=151771 RepID=UPI00106BFBA5|nr:dual specificity protein phosphatase 14-like [Dendronephthya gigantea]
MDRVNAVTDFLYLGGIAGVKKDFLLDNGINLIINATMEMPDYNSHGVENYKVKVDDAPGARIEKYFDKVSDLIEDKRKHGQKVFVHCVAGVSRSSSLVIAYLMKYQNLSLTEAHSLVKSKRRFIRPNNGFWTQLIEYEKKLFGKNTVTMVPTRLGLMPSIYEGEAHNMWW